MASLSQRVDCELHLSELFLIVSIGVRPIPDILFNASLTLQGLFLVLLDLFVLVEVVGNDYMSCHSLYFPEWAVSMPATVFLSA